MKKTGLALLLVLMMMCQTVMAAGIPSAEIGSYVTFGRYQQTVKDTDPLPVEWLVLDVQDGKALLISRYLLDAHKYHTHTTAITWEECKLRIWLNDTFLNKAFTEEEQQFILTTLVDNSASQGFGGYPTNGGNDTLDKVFLLSYAEAKKYFTDDDARTCTGTEYFQQAWNRNDCYWYLRSPGYYQQQIMCVLSLGALLASYDVGTGDTGLGIRPAIWVSIEQ